jgi:hypothetical protein
VAKVIERSPRVVYEVEDLNGTTIDGQFYREGLTPVRVSDRTVYQINKILRKRVRHGIRDYLLRWRSYGRDFDSCVTASSVQTIYTWRLLRSTFTSRYLAQPRGTSTIRTRTTRRPGHDIRLESGSLRNLMFYVAPGRYTRPHILQSDSSAIRGRQHRPVHAGVRHRHI